VLIKKVRFTRQRRRWNLYRAFGPREILRPFVARTEEPTETGNSEEDEQDANGEDELEAWRNFLETPFNQIEAYSQYVQGRAQYDTHQGIKGLEFARVCVIMDDSKARGFMFSYERLFGAKADSATQSPGQESSIDRTRRLFYVTCSRAENSLALVAYTSKLEGVRNHVIEEGWFTPEEIIVMA
jgi:DNA helicase II / ATP-dependent DNA helicase PcrA